MNSVSSIPAKMFVLASFFISVAHSQQAPITEAEASATLEQFGIDLTGLTTFSRSVDTSYPVSRTVHVDVRNRYGPIEVSTWDNAVVRIRTTMIVGADEIDLAEAFADAITIEVVSESDHIQAHTRYPSVNPGGGIGGYGVAYEMFIPHEASLTLRNDWGNSKIHGVGGPLTVRSSFGTVHLEDIGGFVRVEASGENDQLIARGLRRGGLFSIRGTESVFTDISGSFSLQSHFGSVEIHSPGEVVDMDIRSEGGPVYFYVPSGSYPDIEARAIGGTIETDLALEMDAQPGSRYGQLLNVDATQRVVLTVGLENIHIYREAITPLDAGRIDSPSGQPFQDESQHSYAITGETKLLVEAAVGDVRIEGFDGDKVLISATKRVIVDLVENAKPAMDALHFAANPEQNLLHIQTTVRDNMETLGCERYQVDLVIRLPRSVSITVYAENGRTTLSDLDGLVQVEQLQGSVVAIRCNGELNLENEKGDIDVDSCEGPLTLLGGYGTASVRHVKKDIDIQFSEGPTILESPGGSVVVRNLSGDIRILALEGILGEYDVSTEAGTISMVKPNSSDATFWLEAQGGTVYATMTLTGIISQDSQSLQGRLNKGTHRVALSARGGNIVLE